MNKFCIITNQNKDQDLKTTLQIVEYLNELGKMCYTASTFKDCNENYITDLSHLPDDVECAIVLGGDGTIIQAANDLIGRNIPILGINLGTLGFLAEIERHNIYQALDSLLSGDFRIENRDMLHGEIYNNQELCYTGEALNDIVITRSGFSRIISVEIHVNNELVSNFRGDGVIVSTPTGSTGYNLSAGGPVIKPDASAIIITPICPHTLSTRSIIVSSKDFIQIKISRSKKTQEAEAIATFDGRAAIQLQTEDIVTIRQAKENTKLVKMYQNSFFDILRTKIGEGKE